MSYYHEPKHRFKVPTELIGRKDNPKTVNPKYRSEFMRDRDRIMYCEAFRRLSGKTQIYLAEKDANRRNRMSHTLEVAQISRTIASALNLDADLAEAISLGHDLGHTPFGHAGEQRLHEIMSPKSSFIKDSPIYKAFWLKKGSVVSKDIFGFKHNIQSVRVVTDIDRSYGNSGLNLTNYTLWGIMHHSSLTYKPNQVETQYLDPDYRKEYNAILQIKDGESDAGSFEAFVVAYSDEIAQWHHDLEDALRGGAMDGKEVCEVIEDSLGGIIEGEERALLDALKSKTTVDFEYKADIAKIVVSTLVNRLIVCSCYNLDRMWENEAIDSNDKMCQFYDNQNWSKLYESGVIGFDKLGEESSKIRTFRSVISEKVHHSKEVERMNSKGKHIIKKLFQAYFTNPQQLDDETIRTYMAYVEKNDKYLSETGMGKVRSEFENFRHSGKYNNENQIILMRHICDYIAGMTDHFANEEFAALYF